MPLAFLLNPLPRGKAGKKKGKKMAKKRKKRKTAAKSRRKVATKKRGTRRKVAKKKTAKKRSTRRKVARKKPATRKTATKRTVKKARKKARKTIKRTGRKKLTPFFAFMMSLKGKMSVAKAKMAGAKWRKMTTAQKAKWGKIYTPKQRKAARSRSRTRSKSKAKTKRRASSSYQSWKSRRGKTWKSKWTAGMKKSAGRSGYTEALLAGVAKVNPFGSTRKRRVHRKGSAMAKKRKKSRRKAKRRKTVKRKNPVRRSRRRKTSRRRKNPVKRYRRKTSRRRSSRRRRNPAKFVSILKSLTTKSSLKQYGWVTLGVTAGAIAPNLIAKGVNKLVPSVNLDTPIMRAGVGIVGSLLAGAVAVMVTKSKDKGAMVAAGGIAGVVGAMAISQINMYLPGVAGMSGLGATDAAVRQVVEREIRRELGVSGGVGDYVTQESLQGVGDYATTSMVTNAPTAAGLGLETADDVAEADTFGDMAY